MSSTLTTALEPLSAIVPRWLKLDGTAQAFALWWYMSNYTGLNSREIFTIVGLNAGIHGILHDTACILQGDE